MTGLGKYVKDQYLGQQPTMTIVVVWCNQHQEAGSIWNDQMGLGGHTWVLLWQAVENLVSGNECSFLTL